MAGYSIVCKAKLDGVTNCMITGCTEGKSFNEGEFFWFSRGAGPQTHKAVGQGAARHIIEVTARQVRAAKVIGITSVDQLDGVDLMMSGADKDHLYRLFANEDSMSSPQASGKLKSPVTGRKPAATGGKRPRGQGEAAIAARRLPPVAYAYHLRSSTTSMPA